MNAAMVRRLGPAILVGLPIVIISWVMLHFSGGSWWPSDLVLVRNGIRQFWGTGDIQLTLGNNGNFYAPPWLVLLSWVGSLPATTAVGVVQWLSVILLVAVIVGWGRREDGTVPWVTLGLGGSVSAISLVAFGQFGTAIGLAALAGALLSARKGDWLIVGIMLGIGSIRLANLIPIAVVLLIWAAKTTGWRALGRIVFGAGMVLIPATVVVSLIDPSWPAEYLAALKTYPAYGVFRPIVQLGLSGNAFLLVCSTSWCMYLLRRGLSLDRCAAALLVTALFAPLGSTYALVFGLPALARLGLKPAGTLLPFLVALPWMCLGVCTLLGRPSGPPLLAAGECAVLMALVVLLHPPTRVPAPTKVIPLEA
ncbi:MAG TPA: hypothetical protein VIN65_09190 [Candidatus Dormibacteraeota bacterium]|jgi:hypothetical protein